MEVLLLLDPSELLESVKVPSLLVEAPVEVLVEVPVEVPVDPPAPSPQATRKSPRLEAAIKR